MERLRPFAVWTAVALAALGVVGGALWLSSPPPDTDIGSTLHVDAGPAAATSSPATSPEPTPTPTEEPSDDATDVPNAPPVVVDDHGDDDDPEDSRDDG